MFNKQNNSRKAQAGQTITWIAATIVILVILFLFFFAVGSLAVSKTQFLGLSNFIGVGSSEAAVQQMLFAILNKETSDGTIVKDLIKNGQNDKLKSELGIMLKDFSNKGVNCDITLFQKPLGNIIFEINEMYISSFSNVAATSVELNKINIHLMCLLKQ